MEDKNARRTDVFNLEFDVNNSKKTIILAEDNNSRRKDDYNRKICVLLSPMVYFKCQTKDINPRGRQERAQKRQLR